MTGPEDFEELRALLFAYAHRVSGKGSTAPQTPRTTRLGWEDSPARSAGARALLTADVTRITADVPRIPAGVLRPARTQGQEPARQAPGQPAEPAGPLPAAALAVLDGLSPLERAVFVLREVFGCGLAQTASAVGCSEAACRQLSAAVSRAVGGGRALPWPRHVVGAQNVVWVLAATIPPLVRIGVTVEQHLVDGEPGALFRDRNGTVLNAMRLDILDGRIQAIHLTADADALFADAPEDKAS
ncbi:sigma factor-like helix-turn-helix DNA-binding protein [Streptomyces sp. NPDC005728]|uniref:sigma factor-like helix-turn-helix DNA-binding protein n=1 Tax=Streptomyces sp. NPDC005728 TaxID=3157054 RepID=UPI0033D55D2D